jgi:hypothetical protein
MAKKNRQGEGGGRPTDYDYAKYHKLIMEYIDECVDEEDEFHKTRGDKSDSYERIIRVNLPSIEGLAIKLKLSKDTIYAWKEKYPKFSYDIGEVMKLQAKRLMDNGLNGTYNPMISKLLLSKHGYRDESETDLNIKSVNLTDLFNGKQ